MTSLNQLCLKTTHEKPDMLEILKYDDARNAIAAGVIGLMVGWRVARSLELKNPEREWTAIGTGALAFATCGWVVPILFGIAVFLLPAYLAISWWVGYLLKKEQQALVEQDGSSVNDKTLRIASQSSSGDEHAA